MSRAEIRTIRKIRFVDHDCYRWLLAQAPCRWVEHIRLTFDEVRLSSLEGARSFRSPRIVKAWLKKMRSGRSIAPLVVSKTDHGTYYVHDGNHRLDALRIFYCGEEGGSVRVAVAVPNSGFIFRFRRFGSYDTYTLERVSPTDQVQVQPRSASPSPLPERALILVAHPDDEAGGCAGLLQRIRDPLVFFATEGCPADEYFWGRFGSQRTYSRVRRLEAVAALSTLGVRTIGFLGDWAEGGNNLRDQELFRFLPIAFNAVSNVIRRFSPEAVLVPAYEGGHPDHDACSFLGYLLRRILRVSVWEMPLYHRSENGSLVCRQFRIENGTESYIALSPAEAYKRKQMVMQYCSQHDLEEFAAGDLEIFRPQPDYDYSRPPHDGALNYQIWQWPISPTDICREFSSAIRIIQAADSFGLNCTPPSQDPLAMDERRAKYGILADYLTRSSDRTLEKI